MAFKDVNRDTYIDILLKDLARQTKANTLPPSADVIMHYIREGNMNDNEKLNKHGMLVRDGRVVIRSRKLNPIK